MLLNVHCYFADNSNQRPKAKSSMEDKIIYIKNLRLFFATIFILADQVSDIFLFAILIGKKNYGFAGKLQKYKKEIVQLPHNC